MFKYALLYNQRREISESFLYEYIKKGRSFIVPLSVALLSLFLSLLNPSNLEWQGQLDDFSQLILKETLPL